jgi:glycosyltransferase involved in cell wall biosynthesis
VKIGIVTISYNQAKYLAEAIESVSVADPDRLEYVIADPGSSDGSRQMIERYHRRFDRIILEKDGGPPDGLNKGFAATGAEILGYLNSDDRFTPGALDYVLDYFERRPQVDVLCGAIRVIDEKGHPRMRARTPDRIDLRRYAYETCFFWQQATFFRRRAFLKIGGFNVRSKTTWDAELVVDMALAGCRFAYTNKLLGDFRIHGESITGSGRLTEELRRERLYMRDKILRAGVRQASSMEIRVRKALYKFNLRRHWSYLFAGEKLEPVKT